MSILKGPEVPAGLMKRCNKCKKSVFTDEVIANDYICPKCGGYLRVPAEKRIEMIADKGSFEEWDKGLVSSNPLRMKGYPLKVQELQETTNLDEAITSGKCTIGDMEAVLMVMDGRFLILSGGWNIVFLFRFFEISFSENRGTRSLGCRI